MKWPAIIAVVAALLTPSVTAIVIVSQMHQRLTDFGIRLDRHERVEAHGSVEAMLAAHNARITGQGRSLETVRRSNDRLADAFHDLSIELKVLKQHVIREHMSSPP